MLVDNYLDGGGGGEGGRGVGDNMQPCFTPGMSSKGLG